MAEEIWKHRRSDDDARVAPRLERDPPLSFTSSTNSYTNRQEVRSPTLAGNDGTGDEPTRWMAVETIERREDEKKSPTKPAEGAKKIQRWKDASGTDTSARANQECTAQRPPRCAPDANGQNAAVSEMAGATSRAVRSRAKLEEKERRKLVQELRKREDARQLRARHNKRKDDDGPCDVDFATVTGTTTSSKLSYDWMVLRYDQEPISTNNDHESGTHPELKCLWPDHEENGETKISRLGTELIPGVLFFATEEASAFFDACDVPQILLEA